jgi:hypothetical protein
LKKRYRAHMPLPLCLRGFAAGDADSSSRLLSSN